MLEACPHLSSKHTRLQLLGDDEDGVIQTVPGKTERRDDDGRVTLLTVKQREGGGGGGGYTAAAKI